MRCVEEKEQKGQKEAQQVSSAGIRLVARHSAGPDPGPGAHGFVRESGPAAGPLRQAPWPPLCMSRQPGRQACWGEAGWEAPNTATQAVGSGPGLSILAKPPLGKLQNASVRGVHCYC